MKDEGADGEADGNEVEAEAQMMYDAPPAGKPPMEQICYLRAEPSGGAWDVTVFRVRGQPYGQDKGNWPDKACDFFALLARALQVDEIPNVDELLDEAFAVLPTPVMSPSEAYRHLVHDEVEQVSVAEMDGRISAVGIVPYPPGIPVLMPGERAGGETSAVLDYLAALQDFDNRFPGFAHTVHGVEFSGGAYRVLCVSESASR